jgi:regulator of sigma E protease
MFTAIYILLAILGLGLLVFFHELGHYLVARWVGMKVEAFSIGFGTPLLKWNWDGVDWQIGWLPFGGYVKISGMEFSKDQKVEPHEIPDGFFSQPPWKRIAVALAGPIANFIIAFLVLAMLWGIGGRVKPFSEYTQVIGWVDPKSEIFEKGVRPGDVLHSYNGHPYTSSKDLLHAGMMEGDKVTLKGEHIDYITGKRSPFSYTVRPYLPPGSLSEIKTTGIVQGASFLIYDKLGGTEENIPVKNLPISHSGLTYEDQIVWANGERIFSMEQLNHLINSETVLLTVQRGETTFLSRQPRVLLGDLNLSKSERNDFLDWYFDSGYSEGIEDLQALPYVINPEGAIEKELTFFDEETKKRFFSSNPMQPELEKELLSGDKILSVWGAPVESGIDILNAVQKRKVLLIAKKHQSSTLLEPLKDQQDHLIDSQEGAQIASLVSKIGHDESVTNGTYKLLTPFSTVPFSKLTEAEPFKGQWESQYQARMDDIDQIQDSEKRLLALQQLERMQNRRVLGVILQDRRVEYNPSPVKLLVQVVEETLQTLKALFVGSLNPKWLGGPIGIVYIIQQGWRSGLGEALFWMAAISLNLGIFNLLPIPVLDGGYICLSIFEWITGIKLSAKTMERLILPFAIAIIGLLLFLTVQDLGRLFGSLIT